METELTAAERRSSRWEEHGSKSRSRGKSTLESGAEEQRAELSDLVIRRVFLDLGIERIKELRGLDRRTNAVVGSAEFAREWLQRHAHGLTLHATRKGQCRSTHLGHGGRHDGPVQLQGHGKASVSHVFWAHLVASAQLGFLPLPFVRAWVCLAVGEEPAPAPAPAPAPGDDRWHTVRAPDRHTLGVGALAAPVAALGGPCVSCLAWVPRLRVDVHGGWLKTGRDGVVVAARVAALHALDSLDLRNNAGLVGAAPPAAHLPNGLRSLDLSACALVGPVPDYAPLANLASLNLSANPTLVGPLPASVWLLPSLVLLNVSKTRITGSLLPPTHRLRDVRYRIHNAETISNHNSNTNINGHLLTHNLHSAHNHPLEKYNKLQVEKFADKPPIKQSPPLQHDLPANLRHLDMSASLVLGFLVDSLVQHLAGLVFVNLSHNFIRCPIPSLVKNMHSLKHLDLSYNRFRGTIPLELWSLSSIESINLSHNDLKGPIPSWLLYACPKLTILQLDNNQISGQIPEFTVPTSFFVAPANPAAADSPLSSSSASYRNTAMHSLDISHNNLTGPISGTLWILTALKDLNLSYNSLAARIPAGTFSAVKMPNLRIIDLSHNLLVGAVPADLWKQGGDGGGSGSSGGIKGGNHGSSSSLGGSSAGGTGGVKRRVLVGGNRGLEK
ncbi:hypothetical protein HK100_005462, partial [Physocladia obscura]